MTTLQHMIEATDRTTRSYSGRGMYGDVCLGVELHSASDTADLILDVVKYIHQYEQDNEEACFRELDKMRSLSLDSMGLGSIAYFPGVPFDGEEEEDE